MFGIFIGFAASNRRRQVVLLNQQPLLPLCSGAAVAQADEINSCGQDRQPQFGFAATLLPVEKGLSMGTEQRNVMQLLCLVLPAQRYLFAGGIGPHHKANFIKIEQPNRQHLAGNAATEQQAVKMLAAVEWLGVVEIVAHLFGFTAANPANEANGFELQAIGRSQQLDAVAGEARLEGHVYPHPFAQLQQAKARDASAYWFLRHCWR
jgi:hypothetical protein